MYDSENRPTVFRFLRKMRY